VVALDIPSGVDGTTGQVAGAVVDADETITFGWPKLGLLLHPGRAHAGRVVAVEIGFPPLRAGEFSAALITPAWAAARLPRRRPDAHKGTSGRLLIVAGRTGMAGAAAIAGEAAVRTGTGLVRLASAAENRAILQSLVPEATFFDRATLGEDAADGITAAVIGPGFGTDAASRVALERALAASRALPTLLDADALNLLSHDADALRALAAERALLITPHPRELSRLLGCSLDEIVGDAPRAARRAVSTFGCAVLLKGQPSLVAAPDATLLINSAGSSDVAVGGMGDQLAGVVGALLAAGLHPAEAGAAGLYLSSRAADLAARGRSLSPRDVSAQLPAALADTGGASSPLELPFITFDQSARR
jgi:NAD(P)H-hydrate epimerase